MIGPIIFLAIIIFIVAPEIIIIPTLAILGFFYMVFEFILKLFGKTFDNDK
jgi:hypothetical protein